MLTKILISDNVPHSEENLLMTLADGIQGEVRVLTFEVPRRSKTNLLKQNNAISINFRTKTWSSAVLFLELKFQKLKIIKFLNFVLQVRFV